MRPGQIRVFDGLRVTTEHVEHFQASLHSAIQDIREILGLGVIYSGFEVSAAGNDSITVQPGIAFDRQKNRIVCDEPQTLKVSFAPAQSKAYVCAKYDQIEGGESEGRKTLIWDSCALSLRPSMPDANENVLPLAVVSRDPAGALTVSDVTVPVTPAPAAQAEPAAPAGSEWTVRQGVINLNPAANPPASMASLLTSAVSSAAPSPPGADVYALLAAAELPAGFIWTAVTCYAVLSATVNAPAMNASSPRIDLTWRSTSTGEVTIADGAVSQFALGASGSAPPDLFDGSVSSLPLDPAAAATGPVTHPARDLLARMRLCIRVEASAGNAIKAAARLAWSGEWTPQLAQQLNELNPLLTWTGRLAWKATGRPTP